MSFKNYVSRRVEWHGLDCRTSVSISILRIPLNPSLTLRLLYTYVLYIYIYIYEDSVRLEIFNNTNNNNSQVLVFIDSVVSFPLGEHFLVFQFLDISCTGELTALLLFHLELKNTFP